MTSEPRRYCELWPASRDESELVNYGGRFDTYICSGVSDGDPSTDETGSTPSPVEQSDDGERVLQCTRHRNAVLAGKANLVTVFHLIQKNKPVSFGRDEITLQPPR